MVHLIRCSAGSGETADDQTTRCPEEMRNVRKLLFKKGSPGGEEISRCEFVQDLKRDGSREEVTGRKANLYISNNPVDQETVIQAG